MSQYILEISKNFSKELISFEVSSLLDEDIVPKALSNDYLVIEANDITNLKYSVTIKSVLRPVGAYDTKEELYKELSPCEGFYLISKTRSIDPRHLASKIYRDHGIKGSVKGPRTEYYIIELENRFYVLEKLFDTERRPCLKRGPRFRPFSRSGTLNSELARLMVNVAKCYDQKRLIDPFCGSGSILIEAFFNRCLGLGIDYDIKMLKGCVENLKYFNVFGFSLALADSNKLLEKLKIKFDALVTDPPYGRSTSPKVLRNTIGLLENVVQKTLDLLPKNGRVVLLVSKDMYNDLNIGLKEIFKEDIYVHSSLTRTLVVYVP